MADWSPPASDAVVQPTWTPPAGDKPIVQKAEAKPAEPQSLAGRADELLSSYHPLYGAVKNVVPPLVNTLVADPIRNLAADVVGAVRSPPISDEAREKFWQERKKSLEGTSALHLPETKIGQGISKALGVPGQVIGGLAGAIGDVTGTRKTLGPAATIAGDVLPFAGGLAASLRNRGTVPGEVRKTAKVENKARKEISDRYEASSYEGGPTALDIIEDMDKGRAAGQPMTLADVGNPELQRRLGTAYRSGGGSAASRIKDFFEGREGAANQRVGEAINTLFTDASLRDAMALQASERSAKGRPLWDKAMAHGSTEPFEQAYTKAAQESSVAAERTRADLAVVEHEKEVFDRQAGSRWSQQTDIERRALDQRLEEIRRAVQPAVVEAARMEELRAQAERDGTAHAPGATWSPGLQRLLDSYPELRGLIAHGINLERRFAADDILNGRPFHPNDYAIIGTDASGEAIIGTVPTMRAWHAAKVGIDDKIPGMKDQFGRLTANGASYLSLKNTLLGELDRLNPSYKPARDMWGGDTAVMRAMQEGQQAFSETQFPTSAHLKDHVEGLSNSEKQAFVTAMAQDMRNRLSKISDARDKSQLVNQPFIRERVSAALGDAGDRFLDMMEREHSMKQAGNAVMRGSQSAERIGADVKKALETPANIADIGRSVFHMRPIEALRGVSRLLGGRRPNPAVEAEIGRLMTDPNLRASPTGPILPPGSVPRGRVPAIPTYVGGTLIDPDDGLARALQ